ncbi:MAG: ABC transporter permease [Pseudomonadota bacterium]
MALELVPRAQRSAVFATLSPVIAIGVTLVLTGVLFAFLGTNPIEGLLTYFIAPFQSVFSAQEVFVKASPLIMIGAGLTICFRSNVWNIGAEGQFIAGAIAGGGMALALYNVPGVWVLPLCLVAGLVGGGLWAAIPAVLKTKFRTNEILTSLMLVYIAGLLLDYLVRGPWRSPEGFNFPESRLFHADATMPLLMSGGRLHVGILLAIAIAVILWVVMAKSLKGYSFRVIGEAPRAGIFSGFSPPKTVATVLVLSGALAGLAGAIEVTGPIGQLLPTVSPGYGFTAIIVAFLARLNPLGVILAGVLLSTTYIGGETAQIRLGVPTDITQVIQGLLLVCLLACDTLVNYRIRWTSAERQAA